MNIYNLSLGPFKYYVINILAFLDPTHPTCNQTLLIKLANLCYNIIILPTPPTQSLDYVIFEWSLRRQYFTSSRKNEVKWRYNNQSSILQIGCDYMKKCWKFLKSWNPLLKIDRYMELLERIYTKWPCEKYYKL